MRRATSSCSQGDRAGAARVPARGGDGIDGGGRVVGHGVRMATSILSRCSVQLVRGALRPRVPGQCAVCRAWPAQPVCEACVGPLCAAAAALPPLRPAGRRRRARSAAAACAHRPPLDACHAAVAYGYPWSALRRALQVRRPARLGRHLRHPDAQHALGRARAGRRRPGAADAAVARSGWPSAASTRRWCWRGALAPRKTEPGLLLRVRDTPAQVGAGPEGSGCATCRAPSRSSRCAPRPLRGSAWCWSTT